MQNLPGNFHIMVLYVGFMVHSYCILTLFLILCAGKKIQILILLKMQ
jgi:hypothetical protein